MNNEKIKDCKKEYYLQKFLIFLMFDDTQKLCGKLDYIYDINVIKEFKKMVKKFAEYGFIRPQVMNNIYNVLMKSRVKTDENYKQRIQIINEIIEILNTLAEQRYMNLYFSELCYRTEDLKKIRNLTIDKLEYSIPSIEEFICTDFLILFSHSKDVTDEQFVNEWLPELINNKFYYESLNIILKECPNYFQDKLFNDRMNSIIEMNKNLHPDFDKKSKKIIKRIRKYS